MNSRRKNWDAIWQGVDTRRANAARRDIAARAERERLAKLPQRPKAQMPFCNPLCHGLNHSASCLNVVVCASCGHPEWTRYDHVCLACRQPAPAAVLAKHGLAR